MCSTPCAVSAALTVWQPSTSRTTSPLSAAWPPPASGVRRQSGRERDHRRRVRPSRPSLHKEASAGDPFPRSVLRSLRGSRASRPIGPRRPRGCDFAPRCPLAAPACSDGPVPVVSLPGGHLVRCLRTELTTGPDTRDPLEISGVPPRGTGHPAARVGAVRPLRSTEVLSDVTLTVGRDQCVALVGESGSGKTTLARSWSASTPRGQAQVQFQGRIYPRSAQQRRPSRSSRAIQYIFQNPYTAPHPRKTINPDHRKAATTLLPRPCPAPERDERVTRVLVRRSPSAPDFWSRYPDHLSGGERQRVAIARALVVFPRPPGLRRDHLRPRRVRTGDDCRAPAAPAGRAAPIPPLHHPQPGPSPLHRSNGDRAVPRESCRERSRQAGLRATREPLHDPAYGGCAQGRQGRAAAAPPGPMSPAATPVRARLAGCGATRCQRPRQLLRACERSWT